MMAVIGTSRHFAAAQQFGRIWSEADINHRAGFMTNALREPLINLRIMAHCAFDSRVTVWTGS